MSLARTPVRNGRKRKNAQRIKLRSSARRLADIALMMKVCYNGLFLYLTHKTCLAIPNLDKCKDTLSNCKEKTNKGKKCDKDKFIQGCQEYCDLCPGKLILACYLLLQCLCQQNSIIAVNGGWSDWSDFGTCVNGNQLRVRSCSDPEPENGGLFCLGKAEKSSPC